MNIHWATFIFPNHYNFNDNNTLKSPIIWIHCAHMPSFRFSLRDGTPHPERLRNHLLWIPWVLWSLVSGSPCSFKNCSKFFFFLVSLDICRLCIFCFELISQNSSQEPSFKFMGSHIFYFLYFSVNAGSLLDMLTPETMLSVCAAPSCRSL